MTQDYSICLGTAGWGVWHSPDAGKSWTRHRPPFPLNSRIQALVAHPAQPHTVFAAGDTGIFVSHDSGAKWERRGTQGDIPTIWSLAVDPANPDTLFAGTRPAGVYRSRNGGRTWQKLDLAIATECAIGTPFVTAILVDPDDPNTIWAGVEIDGVFRSTDGGDTWTHLDTGISDPDIHDMTIMATNPKRLFVSTQSEVFLSDNQGETFHALGTKDKWPLPYARAVAARPDGSGVLYAGCGQTTTGEAGFVLRTKDFGQRWETLALPNPANATMWGLATNPADPDRIVAFTLFGEVYATDDAGASWRKIAREFGEIRSAAWLPN
jgi:photosystem II stability/assembly factor-like uncharacterized protein